MHAKIDKTATWTKLAYEMNLACLSPVLAVLLCCCANSPDKVIPPVFSPSELNERSKEFDGKEVTVRGYVMHEREAYGVWETEAAVKDLRPELCISLLYPEAAKQQVIGANRKVVHLRGVFRRDVTKAGGLFLGLCNFSGVTVTSVLQD
jgi:hypothetical protein